MPGLAMGALRPSLSNRHSSVLPAAALAVDPVVLLLEVEDGNKVVLRLVLRFLVFFCCLAPPISRKAFLGTVTSFQCFRRYNLLFRYLF